MTVSHWPKISIVVPSFRQGRFLEAALCSVLDQGYPELELFVADGGSDDESVDVLQRYAPRLTWWTSEPDGGQAHAINKGLQRASGDVVGWLNSDDLLLPGSLRRIGRAFKNPDTQLVCGLRRRIDTDGRELGRWVRDLPSRWYLRHYCCVAQETVYWSRQVLDQVGLLNENMHYALDYEYWLRALEAGFHFTLLPAYQGAIREHPASKTSTLFHVFQRDMAELYRRFELGRSEEEVHSDLGRHWSWHLALLEDFGDSVWSRSPRFASTLLKALDQPSVDVRVSRIYRRFRERRPRGHHQTSLPRAVAGALISELRQIPIEARPEPHLRPASPVSRPRLPWRDIRPEDLEPPVVHDSREDFLATGELADSVVLGAGWSWLEESVGDTYRWASQDAEILILRPSGQRRRLVLELQTGPSLDWQPFNARVLDEQDQEIAQLAVEDRDVVELALPLVGGSSARCFRLHIDGEAAAVSEADPRILRFRLTALRWHEDDESFELPTPVGQPAVIAICPQDITPPHHAERLEQLRKKRRLPAAGLFPGRGWLALELESGSPLRRAPGAAEIVVTHPSRQRARLVVDPLSSQGMPPLLLWGAGQTEPVRPQVASQKLIFEVASQFFDPEPRRQDAEIFRLTHPEGTTFAIRGLEWLE